MRLHGEPLDRSHPPRLRAEHRGGADSEFFSHIGMTAFRHPYPTGRWMWDLYSRQRTRTRHMLSGRYEELLYPIDNPGARFTSRDLPPILCSTLPHLTERYEALYDELGPVVRAQPRQPPAAHLRHLFEWLLQRFGRNVWVERSGGSLLFGSGLLRAFPEARIVHVYRDGRDTALSMSRHYLFRLFAATIRTLRSWGIDTMSMIEKRHWGRISPWFEPVVSACIRPERLSWDKLTLLDFGTLWSRMIDIGHDLFGHFPPDRLLNIRFEDMQADPSNQIRRLIRFIAPSLEDESWLREASGIPRPTPSKFERMGAAEQAALTQACRPGLQRLGYPL